MLKKEYRFKTKPDPHQLECLKRALKAGSYGIFFQQRAGKTKVAIDFCGAEYIKDNVKKIIVVSPLSVRSEWVDQLATHLPDNIPYKAFLYPKTTAGRAKLLEDIKTPNEVTFVIINYDILNTECDRLLKWKADIIIFDESHMLKRYTSKRSKAAYKLAKSIRHKLLLTGTPIPKKPHDIFGQFRVLDDTIFGKRWSDFKDAYCVMGGFMGKDVVAYQNKDALADKIAQHSMRVLREDVMTEPKVERVILAVELEPKALKMYKDLKRHFIAELSAEARVTSDLAGVRVMRLQQLCGGFLPQDTENGERGELINVSKAKIEATVDLVETRCEGGEQVVVFYRFSQEGETIFGLLQRRYKVGRINGAIPESDRKINRDKFQAGELDVMLIQISTGATGISLDKAHVNIFYSLDYSLANFLQAKDRVMGRNQKHDVTNYFMAVKGTVDEKIMRVLKNDEDLASSIADKWRWLLED